MQAILLGGSLHYYKY